MALYGGKEHSPGKHAARNFVYSHSDNIPAKFQNGTHIVISSRECGDIHYLRERGIKKSNIVACDIDWLARQAAWKLGVRVSPYPDIVDTVRWAIDLRGQDDIATVNVDLCGNVRTGAQIVQKVLKLVGEHTAVFLTFVRGRDEGLYSTRDRLDYLSQFIGYPKIRSTDYYSYQSATDTSRGAPMCAVVL